MVATWNPAAASSYYTRQCETEYYVGSNEPSGLWYAPVGDFDVVDNSSVDREAFERLYHAIGENGQLLIDNVRRHKERTPAFDITLSAPRSVGIAWSLASYDTKNLLVVAQQRAVRATLKMLENEAAWARRGQNGAYLEKVALTAATFQHSESRPTAHADGRVFGDPNLHTHCVVLNLSTRPSDSTIGGLHSKIIRDWKMAAGATYHAALAHELEKIGFAIDRIGKNGVFEIAGVDDAIIKYFSARRQEIEGELAEHGVTSNEAVALAAAIAKATRKAKRAHETIQREEVWREAAQSIGIETATFTEKLRDQSTILDREVGERLITERLAALPGALTEHESVVERRELIRAITTAIVGTGLPAERAEIEVERLLQDAAIVEIGRDAPGLPCYSTPETLAIERDVVKQAQYLVEQSWRAINPESLRDRCEIGGLTAEQTDAALAAATNSAVAIAEGAPGVGKSTLLAPVVAEYKEAGCRVIAAASAWRVANMLRDDLTVEARATASWIARLQGGENVLDNRTVLIVDEAGLLSSREMHALLGAVSGAGAKIILVGDRQQLQAIGAGPGLDLVTRAVEAARVSNIIRQREPWAREAITEFGQGRAAEALARFAEHDLLIETEGAKAAINATVAIAESYQAEHSAETYLILAKSNSTVAVISCAIRERRKAAGLLNGHEVQISASTPSGHPTEISLAQGDRIRFLVRNDELGVVNGTVATVTKVVERRSTYDRTRHIKIAADISGRKIVFDPAVLADNRGRARLAWAYASTIYGAQCLTVDNAVIHIDPSCNRHDIYVAASRARERTTLVVDAKSINRRLTAELPIDRQTDDLAFAAAERRAWLTERLSRASPKQSTLDIIEGPRAPEMQAHRQRHRSRELTHEL